MSSVNLLLLAAIFILSSGMCCCQGDKPAQDPTFPKVLEGRVLDKARALSQVIGRLLPAEGKGFDKARAMSQAIGRLLPSEGRGFDKAKALTQAISRLLPAEGLGLDKARALSEAIGRLLPAEGRGLDKARELSQVIGRLLPAVFAKKPRADDMPDRADDIKLPFDSLLRMVGMDYSKIGLMVINALIFALETVASRYLGDSNDVGSARSFNVVDIFDLKKAETILRVAQDPTLPFQIIEDMEQRNKSNCLKQVVCKMAPMLWTMQRAMKEFNPLNIILTGHKSSRTEDGIIEILWKYWPTYRDFTTNSELCDKRYTRCHVLNLLGRWKPEGFVKAATTLNPDAPSLKQSIKQDLLNQPIKPDLKPIKAVNSLDGNHIM